MGQAHMIYRIITVNYVWVAGLKPCSGWEGEKMKLIELQIRLSEANASICLLGSNNNNLALKGNNSS